MLHKIFGEWRNREGCIDTRTKDADYAKTARIGARVETAGLITGTPKTGRIGSLPNSHAKVEVLGLAIEGVGKTTPVRVRTHQGVSCRLSLKIKTQPLTNNGGRESCIPVPPCETVLGLRSKALHSQDSPYSSGGGLPTPAIPTRSAA